MAYIKGNFRKYIFKSDNGFTVGIVRIRETDLNIKESTITFTGYFSELNENDLYRFEGDLLKHDKETIRNIYGKSFVKSGDRVRMKLFLACPGSYYRIVKLYEKMIIPLRQ